VPLTAENATADNLTSYSDCEANTVYIAIDTQNNDSGITTTAVPGKTSAETRRLITMATCAIQFTHAARNRDPDANILNELSHAFDFPEIRKTSIASPTCTAICITP
jgi:hypothetical protein